MIIFNSQLANCLVFHSFVQLYQAAAGKELQTAAGKALQSVAGIALQELQQHHDILLAEEHLVNK